ncbi:MAG: alanine racemase [bacterium]|nr:alanine racemase [bacterium]
MPPQGNDKTITALKGDAPLIWAEIDLQAIAHNMRELRRITRPQARLMVAVKGNAYGHGAVKIAQTAVAHGVDALGVARIEEGVELRQAGLDVPILIMGYTPSSLAARLIDHALTQTVYTLDTARALSAAAQRLGQTLKVHLKVDTGMGRLGLIPDSGRSSSSGIPASGRALEEVLQIHQLPGLKLAGIFTHFASADSADKTFAHQQLNRFTRFLAELENAGVDGLIHHAANSAAIIDLPESHLDMVRAGIALYGLYPSDEVGQNKINLIPAMTLKARIIHLKPVEAGFKVSYGSTYTAPASTIIATVPVGYADGYSRLLSNRGQMLVHGQRVPIVGRVCMDLTMLDVGHIADVHLDDEVVVFGRQGQTVLSADEVAALINTINYEIVAALTARVPRVYKG